MGRALDATATGAAPAATDDTCRLPAVAADPGPSAAALGTRRPPRADPGLREHAPGLLLPGWVAVATICLCAAAAVVLPARGGFLPAWVPGAVAAPHRHHPALLPLLGAAGAALLGLVVLFGLLANAGGEARVLTQWGRYRGTVRRSGLVWVSPLLRRHRVDVRIRHWRSDPVPAVDRDGTPILVTMLVVWRLRDTARALLGVEDHEAYLREQVHSVLSRTASLLPCDSFTAPGPTLRDGTWFADELSRGLADELAPVGVEVYSVQPLELEYGPEVADSMRRRRVADLDADLREVVVGDAVEAAALAVRRLERATAGQLDPASRTALTEQLLVALVAPAGVTAPCGWPGRS